MTKIDALISSADLCARLSISRRTLVRWRKRADFPNALKIGSTLRFRGADIDAWLESQST